MRLTRAAALGAIIVAACAVTGCATINRINPFAEKPDTPETLAEKAKRVPLLSLDETLKPNPALKGVNFFLPEAKPQADWPLPGGTPEQSIEHVQAAPAFQVAWRRKFGLPSNKSSHITASPVASGGRIFVMDGEAGISALDGTTGAQVWKVNLNPHLKRDPHAFGGGLAIAGGKLYVSSGFRFVAALDLGSGKVLWRQATLGPIHDAPTVAGGRVFVETTDNNLLTFDAATGRPDWTYQALTEPARILAAASPAVSGETVVVGFSSGELVALSTANGTELWNAQLTHTSRNTALSEIRDIPGRPIIYRGDVLAGSQSGIFGSIDLRSGQFRWDPLPLATLTTPWAAGDVVFVVSKAGEVVCISRDNGQIYWLKDLNLGRKQVKETYLGFTKIDRPYWTSPILASNRLITFSTEGNAVALNPHTGDVVSTIKIGQPMTISPIAVNGMVYIVTDQAELVAIR